MEEKINSINIRATALEAFWGVRYPTYTYLSYGAMSNSTISVIEKEVSVVPDPFATEAEFKAAYNYCKVIYEKFLPIISDKLNEINNLNLPVSFYRTAFGYWLYRHICIVYDKYELLNKIDIDKTDIRLLKNEDFFTPISAADFTASLTNSLV